MNTSKQFSLEAHLLGTLLHPALPRVLDYFHEAARDYLVTEFVLGDDLELLVKKQGALPESVVRQYANQILDGLEYLHSRNIIHGDIKPRNIVINQYNNAVLVGFGFARIQHQPGTTSMPRFGTPSYSPIEQYGGMTTDIRLDIYSLGATLYFALTARIPPPPTDRVIGGELLLLRQINPSISRQAESVIQRAIALNRADRWSSAREMRIALALRPPTAITFPQSTPATVAQPAPLRRGMVSAFFFAVVSTFKSVERNLFPDEVLVDQKINDVENARSTKAIASIGEQEAWLPANMPYTPQYRLGAVFEIAQRVHAALESETLYNKQIQWREAIAQTKKTLAELSSSKKPNVGRLRKSLLFWHDIFEKQIVELQKLETIPNVFVAGSPLATASKVFKGRHDLFVALERELASQAEQRPTLLLFGARRSGKTSAIKQMPVRLGPDVIPVEVDLQSAATAENVRGLLCVLADQIKRNALTHRRVQLPTLTRDDLRADPYVAFGDWLNRAEEAVGARWILLNLDEYEKLSEMMDAGRIDQRVFDFLRGIIQHHPRVTVLLSGSHTLEDLPPIWSDYLINVRVLKIENLKEDEARELIVKPIENFPLEYEPAAVERILAVTGCQPFLVQATCRDLVNALNEQNRTTATLADADRALDSVLTTGVAYFQDLWGGRDSDDAQRAVMCAVATQKEVGAFDQTPLRKLIHRDILAATDGEYKFRVELVRRWVERNAS